MIRNGTSNNYKHIYRIHRRNIQRYTQLHGSDVVEPMRMLNGFINRAGRGLARNVMRSWRRPKLCFPGAFKEPGNLLPKGGLRWRALRCFFLFRYLRAFFARFGKADGDGLFAALNGSAFATAARA